MDHLKMFGIAVAAIALVIVITAGSASAASTLCKVSTSPCPEGSRYKNGDHITATAGTVRLTGSPELVCASSGMTIKLTNSKGESNGAANEGTGNVTNLTFTGCKTGETSCTVTVEGLPYHGLFDVVGSGPNAILTTGAVRFLSVCAGISNCTYSREGLSLPLLGGASASLTLNAVNLSVSGNFLCISEPRWDATYTVKDVWARALP